MLVRVHGSLASRLYLRGWSVWWPGAQLVREGWWVDVYQVSGDGATFQAAIDACGCWSDGLAG